jgi:hypothetical protein
MKRGRLAVATAVVMLTLAKPLIVSAFPDYLGSRSLGMGGAGRADARGDQGPLLNPAGMSLSRLYTLDGGYQFISRDGGHVARVSVVDSTSSFNLAGGLFYGYRTASPAGVTGLSGHEAGVALSYPFGDRVLLGVTGKYVHVAGGPQEATVEPDGTNSHAGITADVGAVVRAASILTIGVVAYNLHDLSTRQAPVAVGYGVALYPVAEMVVAIDGFHDFTTSDDTRDTRTTVAGGVEYMFQHKLVVRAGGGRDASVGHPYLSAGFAAVSEIGALDFSLRQDIAGDRKLTFLAVALRLFVPQP